MKVLNTKTVLLGLDGKPIPADKGEQIILGNVISNVLSGPNLENPARAYQLAKQIATNDEVTLKAEDIVYLKKVIQNATYLAAIISGQVLELLDN